MVNHCLRWLGEFSSESAEMTSSGKLFQNTAKVTGKAQLMTLDNLTGGTMRWLESAELSTAWYLICSNIHSVSCLQQSKPQHIWYSDNCFFSVNAYAVLSLRYFMVQFAVISCSQILRWGRPSVRNLVWTSRDGVRLQGTVFHSSPSWRHVWQGTWGKGTAGNCSWQQNDGSKLHCFICFFCSCFCVIVVVVVIGCRFIVTSFFCFIFLCTVCAIS